MVKTVKAGTTIKIKYARGREVAKPVAQRHGMWIKTGMVAVLGGVATGIGAGVTYAAELTKTIVT